MSNVLISQQRILAILESSMGKDLINYLNDDDIVEIMLNPDKKLWIDTHSKGRVDTGIELDENDSSRIIKVVADASGEIMGDENLIISTELLKYGSRFEGLLPPIVENPIFTIRKKAILVFTLVDYLEKQIINQSQYEKIVRMVKEKKNILVIGGTGSGKTTLVNAIIDEISKLEDRLVIIEDTQELQSKAKDTVFLRTSPIVNMTRLLKSTMRLRPDRICVGEIRGGEALDLLKAWNSGHPGGVCTIHANDCEGGLNKLEQYILEVSQAPQKELIGNTVDCCIFIKRKGLSRVIEEIKEVSFDKKNNEYLLKDI